MRFNKQELFSLASQTSQTFDREGILIMKERQDGFFRRSDGCSPRWFRLRGNLLFYLRGTEQLSEPIGVVLLGYHQVKVQNQDENGHWPFQIVWGNGVCYRMATYLESERTMWLKAIESAPFDNLKSEITTLQEKLKKHQPLEDIATWRLHRGIVIDMNEIPLCELALSCDNLLCDAHGQPPSPMVVVYVKYPKGMCVKYSCTEVIYKCSNPCFSRTVLFRACDGLTGDTIVRIIVYDMKECVSDTLLPIGYASLLLSTIQEAQRLRIALTSRDKKTVGFVTINGWSLEPSYIGTSPTHTNDRNSVDIPQKVLCHRRSQSLPPRLGLKLKFPSIGNLMKQNFLNSHLVTYRFHSGLGGDITVHEMMAESRLCFYLPLQLLDIYIQREKELLQEILSVGEMGGQWKSKQIELLNTHLNVLKRYAVSRRSLQIISEDKYLKESRIKEEPNLEFAPVNLHLQRLWAHNDTLNKSGFHDVVTVGAFTAHAPAGPPGNGGLIKLVQQVKDLNNKSNNLFTAASVGELQPEHDNVAAASRLRDETAHAAGALAQLLAGEPGDLAPALDELVDKTRALLALWDPAAVEESLSFVTWNKSVTNNNGQKQYENLLNRVNKQLSQLDSLCSDTDQWDSSAGSSKESTPDGELPPAPPAHPPSLSASAPNVCPIRDALTSDHVAELHFYNDYFKPEKLPRSEGERCSSLRISKSRTHENPHLSLDVSRKKYSMDLRSYFKGSSLEQDRNGFMELNQRKGSAPGEESLSLSVQRGLRGRARGAERGEPAAELRAGLAAVVASLHQLDTVTEVPERAALRSLARCQLAALAEGAAALVAQLRRARAAARLRTEVPHHARAAAALQLRRDACFSQALTAACTGLVAWLSSTPHEAVARLLAAGLGPLCCFEGLLTLYLKEKAMWGDMVVAIEDLQTVVFVPTKMNHCGDGLPAVSGGGGALTVHIPVSDSLYAHFQNKQQSFTVTAVFFNVGINEKAAAAEALGEAAAQAHSNADNLGRLLSYSHKYRRAFPKEQTAAARASARARPLEEVLEQLRAAVHKKAPRNHEVLQLAALAARLMTGIRFTSCKSAKDRTGMSVTLEQCAVLAAQYHLADSEAARVLRVMRSEGCRRENTLKNIGVRKYAFTKKQVAGLPPPYRPPPGTYGSLNT